jgi:hypothetical protein
MGVALFTAVLAGVAILQYLTIRAQARHMREGLAITKQAADAAKASADAAITASMPILSPFVVGGDLHPLVATGDPIDFQAKVNFVFENFGKTPAVIRQVRADLFLNEMDRFPSVEFGELPVIDYKPIIAGDSRGEKALMGVAECTRAITLTQAEFKELLADASGKYRRFALIGQVIYDDFFDNRHTRRFCVKMRRVDETHFFQLVRGDREYNNIYREKMPNDDPPAITVDRESS